MTHINWRRALRLNLVGCTTLLEAESGYVLTGRMEISLWPRLNFPDCDKRTAHGFVPMMNESNATAASVRPAERMRWHSHSNAARPVGLWLLACCAAIYAMVVVGGITRLTGSGLSIVEWEPILGTIPPLNEQAWEETFAKYRQSPEFRKVNVGMTLERFKAIYWIEYFHRLLGRAIGLMFL
ncbi:MAG: COX15/CtaA family protein, partial [Gammaproteobacteria bacterium]